MTYIVMYRCTVFAAYHSVFSCSTIQAVGFVIAGADHIRLSRKQQIGVTPSSDLFHQSDFASTRRECVVSFHYDSTPVNIDLQQIIS